MENTELEVLENKIKALEIEILALEKKYNDSTFDEDKNKIGKEIEQKKVFLLIDYNKLAFFLTNIRKFREAIVVYKNALKVDPNFGILYSQLGMCYANLHELESAKPYFEKAYELRNLSRKESQKNIEETYQIFSKAYQKSLIKSSSENINEFGKENLAFAIKKLCVNHFQSIKSLEIQIPTDAQFVCLLGQNGDGKTSILQALAVGLQGAEGALELLENPETQIAVEFVENSENQIHNLYREPNAWRTFAKCSNSMGYSAKRLDITDKVKEDWKKINPFECLFKQDDKDLLNIERWLVDDFLDNEQETDLAKQMMACLQKLLPSIEEVKRKKSRIIYVEYGMEHNYRQLSAGNKSIISLVGDILIRLIEENADIKFLKDLNGIVLIDELETHLHPRWQKEFPKILSEIFPKVQFIVTTHSAICLLGMPENTAFFRVKRDFERGTFVERLTIDVANLLPNQLLTSPLFDMESIFSVNTESIYETDTGIMYKNKAEREKEEAEFEEILKKYKKA